MKPWLVRLWRPLINRDLKNNQRIIELDIRGIEHVQKAIKDGAGVLIVPNHSFHYDSYVLIEASHRVGTPFHFLTAWQVFAMSKWHEQLMLQWHGCFSINREAADLAAFKTAVEILKSKPEPLVIFPEGDIYHNNDRVTPFRDGAAAIAMSAAKKAQRPIVCIPCALKCFYLDDPTPQLQELMTRLEEAIHWRPRPDLPLADRIYRFAEGMLVLKEMEYLGQPQPGPVKDRTQNLIEAVLSRLETRHNVPNKGGIIPERVKEVRRVIIKTIEQNGHPTSPLAGTKPGPGESPADAKQQLAADLTHDMEDLFFIIQLFSYPGDYVAQRPTIERIAETLDKAEEDVLRADYPAVRGKRRAVVRFGEPIPIPKERDAKSSVEQWTDLVESRVQQLLDEINATNSNHKA
jgi:1-acyl-sn-glycerol-3-phosphate acyltransferase